MEQMKSYELVLVKLGVSVDWEVLNPLPIVDEVLILGQFGVQLHNTISWRMLQFQIEDYVPIDVIHHPDS